MNLSRAYTLAYDEELSVGRVQTPTLAMLVERELAIRAFVPEDYLEVVATFHPTGSPPGRCQVQGTWFREPAKDIACKWPCGSPPMARRPSRIVARARTGKARIESIESETQRMPPPLLYDLTELQRHANRLFGFSAQKTLDTRAGALREPQADQLSAHRQPPPVAGRGAARCRRSCEAIEPPYRERSRPAPASGRWAGASWTTPKSPTTTPSSPPTTRPTGRSAARRAQDLRPDLPPPAQRLARRSHLVGHHGDHRDSQCRA